MKRALRSSKFLSITALVLALSSHHAGARAMEMTVDTIKEDTLHLIKTDQTMDTPVIDFESLKSDRWSELEQKNVAVMADFVQHLMNNHDFAYMAANHPHPSYTQYNRGIPDGMPGLLEYVKGFAKRFPDYSYDVKHIYADGPYVTFQSHVTLKKKHRGNDKKGWNIMDTWQLEDGQIVGHWDAMQPLDGSMRLFYWFIGGKVKNNNGTF